MKIFKLLIPAASLLPACNLFAQSPNRLDSIEFEGRKYPAPISCETSVNMIKCDNYILSWFYEPVEDMPRHKKELMQQLIEPETINILLANQKTIGLFDHN